MSVSQELSTFIKDFYAASDVGPAGHDDYVNYYTPDCTLIMGANEFKSQSGVRQFREAGWEKVSTRKHIVDGVFPSSEKPDQQVMLYGTVDYGMKDGTEKKGIEWAALMNLAKVDGSYKLAKYQVWIVCFVYYRHVHKRLHRLMIRSACSDS
jgi:hypothetical protein